MEKTKKVDKLPLDPQREFLDMDTDDEDFGRQESPETEEEQSSEPIKPVFDEQDLDKLVQYVKDFTILPYIKDSDWKEDSYTIIREYFENPAHTLLCIYFQDDTVKARLRILDDNQSDFIYFLRIPWHVFTVDNFHATVVFGSINRNAIMCVLKVMENMYVSVARNSSEWPEIIRNNLFFNLHNFLMCLTEWVYKPMGLTKLYIPGENLSDIATLQRDKKSNSSNNETNGLHISKELQESEKVLIDRFERIVRYWIKQIRQVLTSTSTSNSGRTVFDELQYWTTKYFNLRCLHDQLSNMKIQSILHLLENVCSPSIDSFQLLTLQLCESLEQAASNVMYLNILSEACKNLKCPNEIEKPIMKILLLILFIWTESSFYNMSNNIAVLCEAISIQIVHQCKNYVNLQVILEGDTENGINILRKCISCCQIYKTIYNKFKITLYKTFFPRLCIFRTVNIVHHCMASCALIIIVWEMFDKEIENCNYNTILCESYYTPFQCYSKDVIMLCIKQYLERLFHIMIDMSDWIGDCAAETWSRNGHKLLSASTDNNVCIWDVLSGECDQKYRFPSPILKVQFHPRNLNKFLVCPMRHAAVMVDVEGTHRVIPLDEDSDLNIVASFDRRGDYVYTGNARGRVLVLDAETLNVKASYKITQGTASNTAVKSIEFARRGSCFLVNTADRVIRVYDSTEILACGKDGEPEPIQKLQDLVNKTMWKKCCFSGDGEYVCAGSARQHALYVWEKSIGNLVKILHGTKGELLLDVVWHPVRPIIASISSGVVSIWAQNQVENWSAFAPDFKELDENVEYEERESEFDLSDEDKSVVQGEEAQDEEIEVDVASIDRVAAFCSSDEETEDIGSLQFLPISPDVEDSEDNQVMPHEPPMKKHRSHDIDLQGAPTDETHPLLNKGKDKPTTKKGRPRLEYKKGK
ncbi:RBBP5 protein, partial [Pseudoatta argentina]